MDAGGDDGPATGELIVDLRSGEVRGEPLGEGRLSLAREAADGFCLRKNRPAVVAVLGLFSNELLGLWYWSGGQDGLPEIVSGITVGGGVVVVSGGV